MKVNPTTPAEQRLALVRESPERVEAHDGAGWVALFAEDAFIEDPVGTAHHRGHNAISAFYQTFIAPNDVVFRVQHDVVSGNEVARDVIIDTTTRAGMHISTPAHLRYRISEDSGELKLQSMQAHWEIRKMAVKALKQGVPGIKTLADTSLTMLRNQGLKGTLAYAKGFLCGVFDRGHRDAHTFASAFAEQLGKDAHFEMGEVLSSGYNASFYFTLVQDGQPREGMAFLEFDPYSKKLRNTRLLLNDLANLGLCLASG